MDGEILPGIKKKTFLIFIFDLMVLLQGLHYCKSYQQNETLHLECVFT